MFYVTVNSFLFLLKLGTACGAALNYKVYQIILITH